MEYTIVPVPPHTLPHRAGYRFAAAYVEDTGRTRHTEFFATLNEAQEWITNQNKGGGHKTQEN